MQAAIISSMDGGCAPGSFKSSAAEATTCAAVEELCCILDCIIRHKPSDATQHLSLNAAIPCPVLGTQSQCVRR